MCTTININKRQKAADHVMEIENQDAFMCTGDIGPVRLSYNPYFLACLFSRNNVFLLQQIS